MPAAIYAATSPDELSAVGIDPSSVVAQRSAVGLPPQPPLQQDPFSGSFTGGGVPPVQNPATGATASDVSSALQRAKSYVNAQQQAAQQPPAAPQSLASMQAQNTAQEAAQAQKPPQAGDADAAINAGIDAAQAPQNVPAKPAAFQSPTGPAPTPAQEAGPSGAPNQTGAGSPDPSFDVMAPFIRKAESGGNYRATNPNSTASGAYQIVNGTWAQFAPQAGVNLQQYPTAGSAPPAVQDAVAKLVYSGQGLMGGWSASAMQKGGNGWYQQAQAAGVKGLPSNVSGGDYAQNGNYVPPAPGVGARLANAQNAQNNASNPVDFQSLLSAENIGKGGADILAQERQNGLVDPRSVMAPINPMYRPGDTQGAINMAAMGSFFNPRDPGLYLNAMQGANDQQLKAIGENNQQVTGAFDTSASLRQKMAQGAMQQQQLNALMGYRQGMLHDRDLTAGAAADKAAFTIGGGAQLAPGGAKAYEALMNPNAVQADNRQEATIQSQLQQIQQNPDLFGNTPQARIQRLAAMAFGNEGQAVLDAAQKGNTYDMMTAIQQAGGPMPRNPATLSMWATMFAHPDAHPEAQQYVLNEMLDTVKGRQALRQQINQDTQDNGGNLPDKWSPSKFTATAGNFAMNNGRANPYGSISDFMTGPRGSAGVIAQQQAAGQSPGKDQTTGGTKGASFSLRPGVSLTMN